ncbi:MAG: class I SAM-dependent methyltransferase [Eubacteriales bacterium]|nr:class I SAM-dependent methyltransferase [Eubacteriales bacterium]
MYTSLAGLYDRLMDDVDYAAWARYYIALIERYGKRPASVFECACGTGALTAQLARWGFKLTAADLSEEMLEAAALRLRKSGARVPLVRQDMRALEAPRRVDAIIACCDGANYLTDDEGMLAFAQHAFAALRCGGVLAFDVSSLEKLRQMGGQVFCDERDDVAAIWRNSFDEASACLTMEVSLFVQEESGLYRRMEEVHVQRGRTAQEIVALLEQAGFEDVRVWGDMTFEPPAEGAQRIHFTAKRP